MNEKTRKLITWLLLAASVVMIVLGVMRGEPFAVFNKAIKVCIQCIGIG